MQQWWEQGIAPSLGEVLDRREARAVEIRDMLDHFDVVTVLTLNIPGPIKTSPRLVRLLQRGVRDWEKRLCAAGAASQPGDPNEALLPLERRFHLLTTGPEALWGFRLSATKPSPADLVEELARHLKRLSIETEESSHLARLFDFDVYTRDGQISREDLGGPPRRCFLCDQPAKVCARSRAHSVREMQEAIGAWLEEETVESCF